MCANQSSVIKAASTSSSRHVVLGLVRNLYTTFNQILRLVQGKELGGKTSFAHLFMQRMYPEATERKRRVLVLDAATTEESVLLTKLDAFKRYIEHPKTKPHTKFPYVVIENFHVLNPRTQQHSIGPQWEILNEKHIFFLVTVAPDASKVTEQIKSTSKIVRLRPLEDIHVLEKLLTVCVNQRIGFVRPAIDYIAKRRRHALGPCLDTLQQIFHAHQYLSMENVDRFFHRNMMHMKDTLDIADMCAPLKRCKVCTLVPPCAHTTLQHLHDRVVRLRAMYPQNNQRDVCPDFKHTGICHVFNRKGRCLYDHPPELHVIDTSRLAARCPVHTLPQPCSHCATLATTVAKAAALAKDKRDMEAKMAKLKKTIADMDYGLHVHLKANGATVVWGKAKDLLDAQTVELQDEIQQTRRELERMERHVKDDIEPVLGTLQEQNQRGYCKGLGKRMKLRAVASGDPQQGEE
ncbi:hypothetical protein, variant 3 [Aphanomyces astaci]|uniref:Uncharacterized protein n=1 Tax=Aphanomyces astaci TaxID=112090 RepID=W4F9X3_APHAT|nr:hypothetical protein, variant 2 [Aphanomyces astaci]XP_009846224.1 hypothetical protein, variant 3 [Aphanomyces astaci]ETV64295.1 hypothetical protein, variant 2 [Aphanomyces astaci]ETV64296.1 hypothetical protein, variant 3 [Aphanomyces astaci]|eukprot:XP_009846223.1 hypothetical protein, variant 2 [Aphanomyces astaci]